MEKTALTFADAGQVYKKLGSVTVKHDQLLSRRPGYNAYALAQYCEALSRVIRRIQRGDDLRLALLHSFNGSLLDKCLRACGLAKSTPLEKKGHIPRLPDLTE